MLKILIPGMLAASIALAAGPGRAPNPLYEAPGEVKPAGKIDELVFARLKKLGIEPAYLSSDSVFVRRVYLDVIGTLPTPEEAAQFYADTNPNKRQALIDKLLERPEFADYWAVKWADILRIKAEFPINLWPNAAQAYHRWVVASLRENKPYDRMVRELLTESGSNFRVPPVNFYRAMQTKDATTIAQTVSLAFMGMRADKWPKERLASMAVFFSQVGYKDTGEWKEEIVFFDSSKALPKDAKAVFPDGTPAGLDGTRDPRLVFADWLTSPKNPYLARAITNRMWSWLMGAGIVQEADDFRDDNPPRNPELLDYLAAQMVAGKFDVKAMFRQILNSKTYQFSSIPRSTNPEAAANFAYYPLRRLDAEVLADALCQVTGTTEKYTSPIPEPYTVIPDGDRSIRLPDGSITSAFLELFGRPPRDTGLEVERNNRITAAQRLHMLNSSHVQRKIEQSTKLTELARGAGNPRGTVNSLYMLILSRMPTDEELKTVGWYANSGVVKGREAVVDLAWALVNSNEFMYRH